MEMFIWFLCCYAMPIFILLMAAPVSTMMPWASAKYSHEYYGKLADNEKNAETKRKFMTAERWSALIIGTILLAVVLAINVFLPIERTTKSIVCLVIGVISFVAWLLIDKFKAKKAN